MCTANGAVVRRVFSWVAVAIEYVLIVVSFGSLYTVDAEQIPDEVGKEAEVPKLEALYGKAASVGSP